MVSKSGRHGQEPVLKRRLDLPEAVDVDIRQDQPPVDVGKELARRSGGQGDGQSGIGASGARRDAGLVDEPGRPVGRGAVDLDDHRARAAGQLVDRALADDPAAVDDRHGVARAFHLVKQVR